MGDKSKRSKYHTTNLSPALRIFIGARNEAIKAGFTDNGGAIHSVERILDILSLRLVYPDLRHINNLKSDANAEISEEAHKARTRGEPVFIEHVLPQRAYARKVIELVAAGRSDDELINFITRNYRLVILSKDETSRINRINRSRIASDRIADAGIKLL